MDKNLRDKSNFDLLNNLVGENDNQSGPSGVSRESQMYEKNLFRVDWSSESGYDRKYVHIVADNEEQAKEVYRDQVFGSDDSDDLDITEYSLKVITNSNEPYELHTAECQG